MARCLKILTNNTAVYKGATGIATDCYDILHKKVDNRTAEEIIVDVLEKTGIEVI